MFGIAMSQRKRNCRVRERKKWWPAKTGKGTKRSLKYFLFWRRLKAFLKAFKRQSVVNTSNAMRKKRRGDEEGKKCGTVVNSSDVKCKRERGRGKRSVKCWNRIQYQTGEEKEGGRKVDREWMRRIVNTVEPRKSRPVFKGSPSIKVNILRSQMIVFRVISPCFKGEPEIKVKNL